MRRHIDINQRRIGEGHPVYIVAEVSANHNQDFDQAVKIIRAAKEAGADAVKLQTYTPDTMTIDCDNNYFKIKETIWKGRNLYDLYGEAYTPWEWQPKLNEIADELGLDFFSTPFDETAVDFLEKMNVPAYKIASFELVDIPLLKRIGKTRKPVIMSTGMGMLAEIEEAVRVLHDNGASEIALLKCTSAYPAPPEEMNLRTIPHLAQTFGVPAGLSDHTLGSVIAVAGVCLGACIIEKHLTLSRNNDGPDASFSMEPDEFKNMVLDIRTAERSMGTISYGATKKQKESLAFRRSLFVIQDMKKGEKFTHGNVRSIRPGYGMHTRYLDNVLGRRASRDIKKGTPLSWKIIG